MKIAVIVARVLLGLLFAFAGFVKVFPVMPMQIPPGDAGAMMGLMMAHKWMLFYGLVELAGGLMMLAGRFVPLGLTLLAAMIVNITLFNATLAPKSLPVSLVVGVLELFLVYAYRASFAGIFAAKQAPAV
jgi:putative oxidoreductase